MNVRISLVVPARNEALWLPRLLDSVDAARGRYRESPAAVEVILADNASIDEDTGVVFCRRRDFEGVGGYREDLRVTEDVDFLLKLRKLGKARGQRLARPRGAKAITSTRKFDEYGDWHYLRNLGRSLFNVLFDRPALDRFVEQYWYSDRVRTKPGASQSEEGSE